MKAHAAICLLCLTAGAALGHFNGRHATSAQLVDTCGRLSVVVFHDGDPESKRRFHCFEIDPPGERDESVQGQRALVPVI